MNDEPYGVFTEATPDDIKLETLLGLRRELTNRMRAITQELERLHRSARILASKGAVGIDFAHYLKQAEELEGEAREISKSDIWKRAPSAPIAQINSETQASICRDIMKAIFKQLEVAQEERKKIMSRQLEEGRRSLFETMQEHYQATKQADVQPPPSEGGLSHIGSAAKMKNHTIKCIECGKTFRSHKRSAKTCSDKCRKRLSRRTK